MYVVQTTWIAQQDMPMPVTKDRADRRQAGG